VPPNSRDGLNPSSWPRPLDILHPLFVPRGESAVCLRTLSWSTLSDDSGQEIRSDNHSPGVLAWTASGKAMGPCTRAAPLRTDRRRCVAVGYAAVSITRLEHYFFLVMAVFVHSDADCFPPVLDCHRCVDAALSAAPMVQFT